MWGGSERVLWETVLLLNTGHGSQVREESCSHSPSGPGAGLMQLDQLAHGSHSSQKRQAQMGLQDLEKVTYGSVDLNSTEQERSRQVVCQILAVPCGPSSHSQGTPELLTLLLVLPLSHHPPTAHLPHFSD